MVTGPWSSGRQPTGAASVLRGFSRPLGPTRFCSTFQSPQSFRPRRPALAPTGHSPRFSVFAANAWACTSLLMWVFGLTLTPRGSPSLRAGPWPPPASSVTSERLLPGLDIAARAQLAERHCLRCASRTPRWVQSAGLWQPALRRESRLPTLPLPTSRLRHIWRALSVSRTFHYDPICYGGPGPDG